MQAPGLAVFLTLALLPVAGAHGQEEALVLRPARVLDVEAGRYLERVVVRVRDGRIEAVAAGAPEPGETVVELPGLTLLPGLIDVHTHLTYDAGETFRPGDAEKLGYHPQTAAAGRALVGAANARRTLDAGFTTVRDLSACCFADVTLDRAIAAGIVPGPDIVPSAYPLTVNGGGCDQTIVEPRVFDGGPEHGVADTRDEIVEAVRYQIRYGARVIKVCLADTFDQEELTLIASTAHRLGVKVAVHVEDAEGTRMALAAGADSIEHVAVLDDETIALLAASDAVLVPTLYVVEAIDLGRLPPKVQEMIKTNRPLFRESFRKALAAGVAIAAGSDTGEFPHGENAHEMVELAAAGATPIQAIRAGTVDAARLLALDDRGAVRTGLRADLVAVPGDPLADPSVLLDVAFVMKEGVVVRGPDGR